MELVVVLSDSKIQDISELINKGESYFLTYVDALCDRIDKVESNIRSLIVEPDRRSRLKREARALLEQYPDVDKRPPLFGIPVGIKDIFAVNGFETQCGSQLPAHLFAGPEAHCVSALRQAGALIVGKTVSAEFAYFEPGPTRNPHNTNHTPGGSSSGSAAAVAAGLCALALGTQTIGSVIRPAAYCGIIGFKPSCNRISSDGLIPYSVSADQVGLFTQDVKGMEIASSIVCSEWNGTIHDTVGNGHPILGVPDGPYLEQTTQEGLSSFENTILKLRDAGYAIRRLRMFEDIDSISSHHRNMTAAEFSAVHARWFSQYGDLYRPRTAEMFKLGRSVNKDKLRKGRTSRLSVRASIESIMDVKNIDAWISPAATGTAPRGITSTGNPAMNLPWTHAGLPSITIPSDKDDNGLPYGLQITTRFMDDEMLLLWAHDMEETIRAL